MKKCTHHWLIEMVNGARTVWGQCRSCKDWHEFPAYGVPAKSELSVDGVPVQSAYRPRVAAGILYGERHPWKGAA